MFPPTLRLIPFGTICLTSERLHPVILWAVRESLTSMFKDTVFSNASTVLVD